jgi:hypothetical protein
MNATDRKLPETLRLPDAQRARRRHCLTITRCFRVPKTLSEQIDEIADLAQIHPSVFMRRAMTRYIKLCKSQPQEIEEIS